MLISSDKTHNGKEYICITESITLLYTRNEHNVVNQVCINKNFYF